LPLGLLALLWPVNSIVLGLPHPFESAFAHGELLIFSVLILLEAAVEGEHLRRQSQKFQIVLGVLKVSAFFLLFIFGFMKTDVLRYGQALETSPSFATVESSARSPDGRVLVPGKTDYRDDRHALDSAASEVALRKMRLYSSFNMLVAIVAVIGSLAAYLAIVTKEYQERMAEMAESTGSE
jgi:hypothetical protein